MWNHYNLSPSWQPDTNIWMPLQMLRDPTKLYAVSTDGAHRGQEESITSLAQWKLICIFKLSYLLCEDISLSLPSLRSNIESSLLKTRSLLLFDTAHLT